MSQWALGFFLIVIDSAMIGIVEILVGALIDMHAKLLRALLEFPRWSLGYIMLDKLFLDFLNKNM